MEEYKVVKYSSLYYKEWNDFVLSAKNSTFLFYRDFMEYHSDRFEDYSLLIYHNQKLIAIFPANVNDGVVYSHQGLSYGGLVFHARLKFQYILESFKAILKFLNSNGFSILELKLIPIIYNSLPSDELKYIMFLLNAKLMRRDVLSVIDLREDINISKNRVEGINKAKKHNLEVKEEKKFDLFWNNILIPNLKNKYGVHPVHSLSEITFLNQCFPNNIRQFNVYLNGEIVAGTTIFETKKVAHAQYISADKNKNVLGSLDYLYSFLIKKVFANKQYFDFGISNENLGKNINKGLQFWKEGFGTNAVTQDFYCVNTKDYILLNNVMQ